MPANGEGRIEVEDGFTIWYAVVGDGDGVPLFVLHGGPGAGRDYVESLADLGVDRPVVFSDRLAGCGRLDQPDDPARRVIARFTREIDVVRSALGLDRVHLLGHCPNEFTTIGNLAGWERSHRLGEIPVPALMTCRHYDELGPNCAATLDAGIPDARTVVFEQSAHLAHVEERQAYMQVVGEFLRAYDSSGRPD